MSVAFDLDSYPCSFPAGTGAPAPTARPLALVPSRVGGTPSPVRPAVRPGSAPAALQPGVGVSVLLAPIDNSPLRLTRRGVAALSLAVLVLSVALVWLAARSAAGPAVPSHVGPAVVTVHAGDTMWSIASRVAPGADPAAEIATIQRLNRLSGSSVQPGQQLRVR